MARRINYFFVTGTCACWNSVRDKEGEWTSSPSVVEAAKNEVALLRELGLKIPPVMVCPDCKGHPECMCGFGASIFEPTVTAL